MKILEKLMNMKLKPIQMDDVKINQHQVDVIKDDLEKFDQRPILVRLLIAVKFSRVCTI